MRGKDIHLNLEATAAITVEKRGGFQAFSFQGPVTRDAGYINLTTDASGKVSGTWKGDLIYQGKVTTTFDGSFSGTLASPSWMTFKDVQGNVTIKEFQGDGSVKIRNGKMYLQGEVQVTIDQASGAVKGYSAYAAVRIDMDGDGKWDSDLYDWKSDFIAAK